MMPRWTHRCSGMVLGSLLLLGWLGGCDRSAAQRQVILDTIQAQEEVVAILQGIQNAQDMQTALPQLRAKADTIETIRLRARHLPAPGEGVKEQLQPQMERLQAVVRALGQEAARISQLPGGADFLQSLKPAK